MPCCPWDLPSATSGVRALRPCVAAFLLPWLRPSTTRLALLDYDRLRRLLRCRASEAIANRPLKPSRCTAARPQCQHPAPVEDGHTYKDRELHRIAATIFRHLYRQARLVRER